VTMRNRPFFVLLVAPLFVALTFCAVGVGWSEGVDGLVAVAQPYGADVAPDSSVSDPEGDVPELRLLLPAPDPGRDLVIQDDIATVQVPRWVVGYPQSFQWVGSTIALEQQTYLDVAPDFRVLDWTRGTTSEAPDAQNPELLPHQDLTRVRLRELESSLLEFYWRCRGDIPMEPVDTAYGAFFADEFARGPDYAVVLAPADAGWMWSVRTPGEARFPWNTASYEDIMSAGVSQSDDGQLTFEMTTAQGIPEVPAEADGSPWFSWAVQQDSEGSDSTAVTLVVVVRWDAGSGEWQAAVMSWDGQDYVDLDIAVAFTLSEVTVSATVGGSDLGLVGSFFWHAMTTIQVGPDEEPFVGLADQAPDSGWVEESIVPATPTPTPTATPTVTATPPGTWRIYLPVICRGVTI